MKIDEFIKFYTSNYKKINLPVFIHSSNLDLVNKCCDTILSKFAISDTIVADLSSISDLNESGLLNFINTTPLYESSKLIVLKNAQKWTTYIKSALLKTLEDYPSYNKFIITSNINLDLTVISRCMYIRILGNHNNENKSINLLSHSNKNIFEIDDPSILFESCKNYLKNSYQSNDFDFLDSVVTLWDKVNETYTWFKKGEISLQNCIQIMSNLISDHLSQTSSL